MAEYNGDIEGYYTTAEAAAQLGVTENRIRQFVRAGRMVSRKVGAMWLIPVREVERFKTIPRKDGYPKGRPRKTGGQKSKIAT